MEKYTYIRKTVTWQNRRYEVRGKTEQEAATSWPSSSPDSKTPLRRYRLTTVDQWFVQWQDTYKVPSALIISYDQ